MESNEVECPNSIWAGIKQGLREGPLVFVAPAVVLWRALRAVGKRIADTQDELVRDAQDRRLRRVRAKR